MNNVIQLCNKYNINPSHVNIKCHATGIGDILFRLLSIKNKLITTPFYINLNYFTKPYYNMDPINQLEFRIKLIFDVLKYNNINTQLIQFIFSDNYNISQEIPYHLIENFNLNFNNNSTEEEYIIFHTKCRHSSEENYNSLKENIKLFCKNTFKYKIIIMGEQVFPHTEEVDMHGITTVYNELLELKNNNDIIDKSIENIYSNLDYDNYKSDINLIQNAKYNICFGLGGQLCTSVIFGKCTIVYCNVFQLLNTHNFKKNNFYFTNTINFFNLIKEKCCL
jgi:hypothetical protein